MFKNLLLVSILINTKGIIMENVNRNRNVFGLNGITGMLIITALLIGILVVLTMRGISIQQELFSNPQTIKMIDSENSR